ncbi:hypothetical protein HDU76_013969, partial [Blyttiomyces sp. JEL0837]
MNMNLPPHEQWAMFQRQQQEQQQIHFLNSNAMYDGSKMGLYPPPTMFSQYHDPRFNLPSHYHQHPNIQNQLPSHLHNQQIVYPKNVSDDTESSSEGDAVVPSVPASAASTSVGDLDSSSSIVSDDETIVSGQPSH